MREHEEPSGNLPSDEQLDCIGEEYLKLAPQLEAEMELGTGKSTARDYLRLSRLAVGRMRMASPRPPRS
jgi:hypothetical protein